MVLAALLAAATGAGFVRVRGEALRPPLAEVSFDVPPFPVEIARPFSFGFSSLASDATFLQAVQVYGDRKTSTPEIIARRQDRALARLLEYTVAMDPLFIGAYHFAGSALPRHALDGKAYGVFAAEQILAKGVRERPDDWRIAFLLGFTESFYLGKMKASAEAMSLAARLPGAPPYVGFLATRLAADAGAVDLGEQMALAMEAEATEDTTRGAWRARRLDLRMERDLRNIEEAVARFRGRIGRTPTLEELVSAGDLPRVPDEPHGGAYELSPEGEARSTAAERLRLRDHSGIQSGLLAQ